MRKSQAERGEDGRALVRSRCPGSPTTHKLNVLSRFGPTLGCNMPVPPGPGPHWYGHTRHTMLHGIPHRHPYEGAKTRPGPVRLSRCSLCRAGSRQPCCVSKRPHLLTRCPTTSKPIRHSYSALAGSFEPHPRGASRAAHGSHARPRSPRQSTPCQCPSAACAVRLRRVCGETTSFVAVIESEVRCTVA